MVRREENLGEILAREGKITRKWGDGEFVEKKVSMFFFVF
jgi:hypothetical protein